MIASCGLPTRLPDARSRAELVGCQKSGLSRWPAVIAGRAGTRRVIAVGVLDLLADARVGPAVVSHVLRQGHRAPRAAPWGRQDRPIGTLHPPRCRASCDASPPPRRAVLDHGLADGAQPGSGA